MFIAEASEKMGIELSVFQNQSKPIVDEGTEVISPGRKRQSTVEFSFLSLLFNNPGSIDAVFEQISPEDFDSKELSRLYSAIISQYQMLGVVDARALIDNLTDDQFISLVTEVAAVEWNKDQIETETRHFANLIIEEKQKRIRSRLLKELAEAEKEGDQERARQIIEEMKSFGLNA